MTYEGIGRPRMDVGPARLRELNPFVEVEAVAENASEHNAARLVGRVDLGVGCAPVFAERVLLNREAGRRNKPLIACALDEAEGPVTTGLPGRTRWLARLWPGAP